MVLLRANQIATASLLLVFLVAWGRTGLPEPPIARATSNLVWVNVVAEDASGNLLADLTRDEFTLLDKGKPQRIAFFSVESQSRAHDRPQAQTQPPNVFSNSVFSSNAGSAAGGSLTAVLFDGLNTALFNQAYVREQISRFLDATPPGDHVALYALGRGLHVLQDFTSDPQLLRSALRNYKSDPTPEIESAEVGVDNVLSLAKQLHIGMGDRGQGLMDLHAVDRVMRTTRALTAIARHFEGVPGRKNLIWVSGSFPLWMTRDVVSFHGGTMGPSRHTFDTDLEHAVRALGGANIAVYPVDARGLLAPANYEPTAGEYSDPGFKYGSASTQSMDVLAARTGGKAFYNNNDLGRAFRQAVQDSRVTYTLAFQPTHDKWNGEFRKIKLSVARPGVRLRYCSGYFAQPEEPSESAYRGNVLSAAKFDPINASRIPLTVRVDAHRPQVWNLEISLDPRAVRLKPDDDEWTGTLDS